METRAMTLRLDPQQAAELEAVARADEAKVSDVVRTAIRSHIEARRRDRAFQERIRRMMQEEQEVLRRLAQ